MVKKIILILFILILLCGCAAAGYAYKCIREAPDIDTSDIYSLVAQRSIMYDTDGNQIDSLAFSDGNRTIVDYDELPEDLIDAVVAIEDKTFWSHHGFNFIRMIGAVKEMVVDHGVISGTSTITQQLARNIYLSDIKSERTLKRKIIEAYYTVILERELSKEKIMESYLNTVYFGFGSYGVKTAALNYFNKDLSDLDLIECAALAALPQAPDSYALTYVDYDNASDLPVLKKSGSLTYVYNGDLSKSRRKQVLINMAEDGLITNKEKKKALKEDLQEHMDINVRSADKDHLSYFIDYTIEQVTEDMEEAYGITHEEASRRIYSGGLSIYTTIDQSKQKILSEELGDPSNYTSIAYYSTDSEGNILSKNGTVILHSYGNVFTEKGGYRIGKSEYEMSDSGDLILEKGHTLRFYEVGSGDDAYGVIGFPDVYIKEDGALYIMQDCKMNIPGEYTHIDDDGNCVISSRFLEDFPKAIRKKGSSYKVSSKYCLKGTSSRQPQAAAVIIENSSGEIKAMMGGRGSSGRKLYNRAIKPHQPGSSIKPIAVYGPALEKSVSLAEDHRAMDLDTSKGDRWGSYITAASIINDAPMYLNGREWPKNAYYGHRGKMTLRTAVQQSVNVCAVKVFRQIGEDTAVSRLKKNGITTVCEEGDKNDINPAALALGGMTVGISPLEMTAAYETFVNGGVYKEPLCYTQVLDGEGDVVLEKEQKTKRVYDEGVAWIMTDILHSVVTKGIANRAAISSQPVGGKTGTTSDQYDIWFAGFTPQYSMALWEGNDVHIQLSSMSEAAAGFWASIMSRICEGESHENFRSRPDNVVQHNGEFFVKGTDSNVPRMTKPTTKKSTEKKDTNEKTVTKKATTQRSTRSATKPDRPTDKDKEIDEWLDDFYD